MELDRGNWGDPLWRLSNLYRIVDEDGRNIPFVPNEEQIHFYNNLWTRNIILKARQLGFTTWCALIALDQCLFNADFTSVMIAQGLDEAGKIFRNKIQYPYDHLPPALRERVPLKTKSQGKELLFANGSSISVTTSARGGTTQFLHVSEMGKIARRYPQKSREIVSGSFESVPATGIIVVESTAEGNAGDFFDMTETALAAQRSGSKLTPLDSRLHFYPWFRKQAYRLDPSTVSIPDAKTKYFDKVERIVGIKIDKWQRAWYVKKEQSQGKLMQREYPSTPEEAFAQAVDGAIYAEQMAFLRQLGRIGRVPFNPDLPVNTFWDLGSRDATAIWLHQRSGAIDRFPLCFGETQKGMRHFWRKLRAIQIEHGFVWGRHYLPHDGKQNMQAEELVNRVEILERLQQETADGDKDFKPGEVVPIKRTQDLDLAINVMRQKMVSVEMDEQGCAEGIRALDNYQYEWDESRSVWKREPLHNWASNYCDAIRQWAQGYDADGGRAPIGSRGHDVHGGVYVRGAY